MPLFDLKKQLKFYGAYHSDPVNVGIHMTCVPLIMATAFLFGANTPAITLPPSLTIRNLPLNLATGAALLYSTLYITMEPVAGTLITPLIMGGAALMNFCKSRYGATANKIAIAVHIVSWIAQFVGHGKYEGRAPALLDNLGQALFLAPFFVWHEALFRVGYRPKFRRELDGEIREEIERFRSKNGQGKKEN